MPFRSFLTLLAIVFLAGLRCSAQEPRTSISPEKPVATAEKPIATPVRKVPAMPAQPAITINSVHVDGPFIALTFDDGPNAT
ncbi:MAG TPA: hypothetical protein VF511_02505, partial [Chthoniobacterales bacterium]